MKHSEFKAFSEPPLLVKMEPIGDTSGLPLKDMLLEAFGSDKNQFACAISDKILLWKALGKLPNNYLNRRTLYFSRGSKNNSNVEIRPLPLQNVFLLNTSQGIALDDRLLLDLRSQKKVPQTMSDEEIRTWVTEEFLLDPISKNNTPALIIGQYASESDIEEASGFSIIGREFIAKISKRDDQCLWVKAVHKIKKIPPYISLWEGLFSFVLDTINAKIKDPAFQHQFEQRRLDQEAFLNLWKCYYDIDSKFLNQKKEEAGTLFFFEWNAESEGSSRRVLRLKNGYSDDACKFERAISGLPLDERDIEIPSSDERKKSIICRFIKLDGEGNFIVEKPDNRRDIPKNGELRLSLSGWEKATERRKLALDRVVSQKCKLFSLYYHLFEQKIPVLSRRKQIRIKESEFFKAFDNKMPNEQQRTAIDICLNTPDIALVQGPPGTGKTQVIVALQKMIASLQSKHTQQESILITSYQHDAVDNVSQRTRIWGLPPYRYGAKKSQQGEQGFRDWKNEMLNNLKKVIEKQESNPIYCKIIELKQLILQIQYGNMPPKVQREFLHKILEQGLSLNQSTNLLSVEVLHELENIVRALNLGQIDGDIVSNSLFKALWRLRITPEAYTDDGLMQLRNAIDELRLKNSFLSNTSRIIPNSIAQLEEFVNQKELTPNDFEQIEEIRNTLIESLFIKPSQHFSSGIKEKMNFIFERMLNEINKSLEKNPAGCADILSEFYQKLKINGYEAKESIAHYTTVYATTCQKSGSKDFLDIRSHHFNLETAQSGFDYVIIDEAARANPLDLLIPMSLAKKKIILVGDHKQLPHLLDPKIENELLKNKEFENTSGEALKESLFARMWNYLKTKPDEISRTVTLKEQYRMHPKLGAFISKVFYESDNVTDNVIIESPRPADDFQHTVERYAGRYAVWENCSADSEIREGTAWRRPSEAKKVADLADSVLNNSNESLGIITFYLTQKEEIKNHLKEKGIIRENGEIVEKFADRFLFGTVDSFQGREFDVVLLSPVRSNEMNAKNEEDARRKFGFLTFDSRLNVALSRQRKLLIVVGDRAMYSSDVASQYVKGLHAFELLSMENENAK